MHLLSEQEARSLLQVLSVQEGDTFEAIATLFLQLFPGGNRFKACCAAILLLEVIWRTYLGNNRLRLQQTPA